MSEATFGLGLAGRYAGAQLATLRERKFQKRLAKDVIDHVGGALSKRRLARWLKTDEAFALLATSQEPALNEIAASLDGELVRSNRKARKQTPADRATYLRQVATELRRQFLINLDAASAAAVADARNAERFADLAEQIESASPWLGLDESVAGRLPPAARRAIDRVAMSNRSGARTLATQICVGSKDVVLRVEALISDPPPWLAALPADAFRAMAELAAFHGAAEEAARCFARARREGAETAEGELAFLEAVALRTIDNEQAVAVLESANEWASGSLIPFALLDFNGTPEEIVRAVKVSELHPTTTSAERAERLLVASAHAQVKQYDQALSILGHLITEAPDMVAPKTMAGNVAAMWGDAQPSGSFRSVELRRAALDHLLEAHSFRLAHGVTFPPEMSTIIRLALALGEPAIAISAIDQCCEIESEQIDSDLRSDLVLAFIAGGEFGRASALATLDAQPFLAHLVDAAETIEDGRREDAESPLLMALAEAETTEQRGIVLRAFAGSGLGIPQAELESFEEVQPDTGLLYRAEAALRAGNPQQALAILQTRSVDAVHYVRMLGHTLAELGNPDDAERALRDGSTRLGSLSLALDAHDLLVSLGHLTRAEDIALWAIATVRGEPAQKYQLRARLMKLATDRDDMTSLQQFAAAACDDLPDHPEPVWHLIFALARQGHFRQARAHLDRRPWLEASEPWQAEIMIKVLGRHGLDQDSAATVLALADQFDDSEIVLAAASLVILNSWRHEDGALGQDFALAGRAAELTERFAAAYPDNPTVRSIRVDASSAESIRDSFRPYVEDRTRMLGELSRGYERGRLPLGLLAWAAGIEEATLCAAASRGDGSFIAISADTDEVELDIASVSVSPALGLVLDMTAIATLGTVMGPILEPGTHGVLYAPESTSLDISVATENAATDSGKTLTWDLVSDQPYLAERTAEQMKDQARALALIAEFTERSVQFVDCATLERPQQIADLDEFSSPHLDVLTLAQHLGVPLLSDDLALRRLARELDIVTFPTYGLVENRLRRTEISDDMYEDLVDQLAIAGHQFLPHQTARFARLFNKGESGRHRCRAILARPEFWAADNHLEAFTGPLKVLAGLPEARERIPRWVQSGSYGSSVEYPPHAQPKMMGLALAAAALHLTMSSTDAPALIAASAVAVQRIALESSRDLEFGDPILEAASQTLEMLMAMEHPAPAPAVIQIFGDLPDADRISITRRLLAIRP